MSPAIMAAPPIPRMFSAPGSSITTEHSDSLTAWQHALPMQSRSVTTCLQAPVGRAVTTPSPALPATAFRAVLSPPTPWPNPHLRHASWAPGPSVSAKKRAASGCRSMELELGGGGATGAAGAKTPLPARPAAAASALQLGGGTKAPGGAAAQQPHQALRTRTSPSPPAAAQAGPRPAYPAAGSGPAPGTTSTLTSDSHSSGSSEGSRAYAPPVPASQPGPGSDTTACASPNLWLPSTQTAHSTHSMHQPRLLPHIAAQIMHGHRVCGGGGGGGGKEGPNASGQVKLQGLMMLDGQLVHVSTELTAVQPFGAWAQAAAGASSGLAQRPAAAGPDTPGAKPHPTAASATATASASASHCGTRQAPELRGCCTSGPAPEVDLFKLMQGSRARGAAVRQLAEEQRQHAAAVAQAPSAQKHAGGACSQRSAAASQHSDVADSCSLGHRLPVPGSGSGEVSPWVQGLDLSQLAPRGRRAEGPEEQQAGACPVPRPTGGVQSGSDLESQDSRELLQEHPASSCGQPLSPSDVSEAGQARMVTDGAEADQRAASGSVRACGRRSQRRWRVRSKLGLQALLEGMGIAAVWVGADSSQGADGLWQDVELKGAGGERASLKRQRSPVGSEGEDGPGEPQQRGAHVRRHVSSQSSPAASPGGGAPAHHGASPAAELTMLHDKAGAGGGDLEGIQVRIQVDPHAVARGGAGAGPGTGGSLGSSVKGLAVNTAPKNRRKTAPCRAADC